MNIVSFFQSEHLKLNMEKRKFVMFISPTHTLPYDKLKICKQKEESESYFIFFWVDSNQVLYLTNLQLDPFKIAIQIREEITRERHSNCILFEIGYVLEMNGF